MSKNLSSLHNAGLKINWGEVHGDFEASQRLLELPRYSFDEKNHWIDYKGDWCLTKGETQALPPLVTNALPTRHIPLWERKSKLSTTTVHCIVEEHVDATSARVKFQTDLSEPQLNSAITGHLVNGVAICPSVGPIYSLAKSGCSTNTSISSQSMLILLSQLAITCIKS
jgi:iron transport multicopper oxidase